MSKDAANDQFLQCRAEIAANQAAAFAAWSDETSAPLHERRERLAQAEAYLAEAEQFCRRAKAKEPEAFRNAARAEVAAAKPKLEADDRVEARP